jgi:hypothetical protein
LQQIKGAFEKMGTNNSLVDSGVIVFDVELPKGERV